ncbi:MAG: hypothetical protein HC795_00070 [Coleofasciculaceae cyanobacterium RL_1_1]|nr:hypothetical protein [Coleofasciculaceae cyanobacterium RL_1_1]
MLRSKPSRTREFCAGLRPIVSISRLRFRRIHADQSVIPDRPGDGTPKRQSSTGTLNGLF